MKTISFAVAVARLRASNDKAVATGARVVEEYIVDLDDIRSLAVRPCADDEDTIDAMQVALSHDDTRDNDVLCNMLEIMRQQAQNQV